MSDAHRAGFSAEAGTFAISATVFEMMAQRAPPHTLRPTP
jgi:hypothetical protein